MLMLSPSFCHATQSEPNFTTYQYKKTAETVQQSSQTETFSGYLEVVLLDAGLGYITDMNTVGVSLFALGWSPFK